MVVIVIYGGDFVFKSFFVVNVVFLLDFSKIKV